MAREVPLGAPSRSARYVEPRSPYGPFVLGGLLAFCSFAVLGLLWLRGTLSGRDQGHRNLRAYIWPGTLAAKHSTVTSCESCHLPRQGVTNFRCQRCHDEAGPGRLTQAAHIGRHFVSLERRAQMRDGPAGQARRLLDDTTDLECVQCHAEHRGSDVDLRGVGQEQCLACHANGSRVGRTVSGFAEGKHPDYWVMTPGGHAGRIETGMSQFSHHTHVTEERLKCEDCHGDPKQVEPGDHRGLDFARIDFKHCRRCHANKLNKNQAHPDTAVLEEVRRLRFQLWPQEHVSEYGELKRTEEILELRQKQLARPVAEVSPDELKTMLGGFRRELATLDAVLTRRGSVPARGDPLQRVAEIARALPPPEAEDVNGQIPVVRPPGSAASLGSRREFQARREELLLLLKALESTPGLAERVAALRARLNGLAPGELRLESVRRARAQREEAIRRMEDELRLREADVPGEGERTSLVKLQESLSKVKDHIASLEQAAQGARDPSDAERQEMREELATLTGSPTKARPKPRGCAYCHEIDKGTFAPMRPAWRVLSLAEFRHATHLGLKTCTDCHGSVAAAPSLLAAASADDGRARFERARLQTNELHLKSMTVCYECHRPGAQRQDCVQCHRYHPPTS